MSPYAKVHKHILKRQKLTDLMQTHAKKWVHPYCTRHMYAHAHVHCVPINQEWDTSASYIFIPSTHSSAWCRHKSITAGAWDENNHSGTRLIQSKQPTAVLSGDSKQQRGRLYVSSTNCRVTGRPLFWVWIWLIGSLLTQAFIMPNRQLTKTRGQSWTATQQHRVLSN